MNRAKIKNVLVGLVVFAIMLVALWLFAGGASWLWLQANDAGWVPHDKFTVVTACSSGPDLESSNQREVTQPRGIAEIDAVIAIGNQPTPARGIPVG